MITEEQFKICARAFFPDCIFEKGKNSTYDYNIIKFNHGPFDIKFVDCSVIIQRGNYFSHYPYICCCEEHLCNVLKNVKNYPNLVKRKEDSWNYGKHWYNNGEISILAETCPEGFKEGHIVKINEEIEERRKIKITENNKGRHWYNNGKINKFCYECPEGFVKGFLDPRWIKKDDGNTR